MLHSSKLWATQVCVIVSVLCYGKAADPVVTISDGDVLGSVQTSYHGRQFLAFKGIPYAKPPIGELRFQAPQDVVPWSGLLNATQDGAQCIQKNYLLPNPTVQGSEDCLFINVFTPQVEPQTPFPVMVYIHGGGFFAGSGASYLNGPEYLLDKNIVVVTFNYRLGAIGFLSTGDDNAPGNSGFKDQVAALRWVKKNIAAFGGNPEMVTIFGQSAGGASVHYHILSPMSAGLFHRAISQSGSALAAWAWPVAGPALAEKQARLVGCPDNNTSDLVRCLRNTDAERIVESGDGFKVWSIDPLNVFGPVVERTTAGSEEPFLSESPFSIIKRGKFNKVPWILGVVSSEGIIRGVPIVTNSTLLEDFNTNTSVLGPILMQLENSVCPCEIEDVWRNISAFFLDKSLPLSAEPNSARALINLYTDRSFQYGSFQSAVMHTSAGHTPVYQYNFDYRGLYSYSQLFAAHMEPTNYGVSHIDDLIYLFQVPALFPDWPANHPDIEVMETLVTLWTNFALYGNPTPGNDGIDVNWEPLDLHASNSVNDHMKYLNIEASTSGDKVLKLTMKQDLNKERTDFWRSLPLKENILFQ